MFGDEPVIKSAENNKVMKFSASTYVDSIVEEIKALIANKKDVLKEFKI